MRDPVLVKAWVRPWMVWALCYVVYFPLALMDRFRDAWRFAVEDTSEEISSFRFSPRGEEGE